MTEDNKNILYALTKQHKELGILEQIDYEKFYLYSIITHSTAIEGSTVTEVEAQLLFDEGLTSNRRSIIEQNMNLDLRDAYYYGREWIMQHADITPEWLISLAAKVMARTGATYNSLGGSFDASKGELRRLNVSAGVGGRSYMSYLKVPQRLSDFCRLLNQKRKTIDKTNIAAIYDLSFWAHYELVTIHPWTDGNGRTCRLLMNLLQMEFGVLPTKVLKEDKIEYIQALVNTREEEDINIFINCMANLHITHLRQDIAQYIDIMQSDITDYNSLQNELIINWQIKPNVAESLIAIIKFMADKDKVGTNEIASLLNISVSTTKRHLQKLITYGYVTSHGSNRNKSYSLTLK